MVNPIQFEPLALVGAVLLGIVHILLQSAGMTQQLGVAFNLSARDDGRQAQGVAARLERASKNFQETFPLFAAAVLLALATSQTNQLTSYGALVYLAARAIYLPIYVLGTPVVRTLVWGIASGSIGVVLWGACCG